jgi:hypothetical protein
VLFYTLDLGLGIPHQAPRTMQRALNAYWSQPGNAPADAHAPTDEEIPVAALEAPREGVGLLGRGQGLPTMSGLIRYRDLPGAFQIISGGGGIRIEKNYESGEAKEVDQSYSLGKRYAGTLVMWRIRAPSSLLASEVKEWV